MDERLIGLRLRRVRQSLRGDVRRVGQPRRLLVRDIEHYARHFAQTGGDRGSETFAPGDKAIRAVALLYQQWLKQAVALDRLDQRRWRISQEWCVDGLDREDAVAPARRTRCQQIDVVRVSPHAITRRQPFADRRSSLSTLDSFKDRFGFLNTRTGQTFCRRLEVRHVWLEMNESTCVELGRSSLHQKAASSTSRSGSNVVTAS